MERGEGVRGAASLMAAARTEVTGAKNPLVSLRQ